MPAKPAPARAPRSLDEAVAAVLSSLKRKSTAKDRANLDRFGITATNALGVSMVHIKAIAKPFGRDHELAAALWRTGCYEARLLTSFVDDPALVTPAQMDRWCRDFDNWAVCDTLCFHLFDRTPHAWSKVRQWAASEDEFVKRAAFALLASIAGHDKSAPDRLFLDTLPLIERAATDNRNFVRKGVSWALRRIGGRNSALSDVAVELARRLAASSEPAARWIGKDALRDFASPATRRRLTR
jgi:3-methyladenine DNA glycosylase AlkD